MAEIAAGVAAVVAAAVEVAELDWAVQLSGVRGHALSEAEEAEGRG